MPVFLFSLFLFFTSGQVFANSCNGIKADPPNIEVKLVKKEPETRHNVSMQQLTQSHTTKLADYESANGRTEHKVNTNSQTHVKNYMKNDKKVCAVLHKIEVTVTQEMTIHVASNYAKDSCHYIAVMNHELEHVGINNRHLDNYVKAIKPYLSKLWELMPPHPLMSDKQFGQIVSTRINVLQEKFMSEAKLDNLVIDTPGSYQGVQNKCKDWPKPSSHPLFTK